MPGKKIPVPSDFSRTPKPATVTSEAKSRTKKPKKRLFKPRKPSVKPLPSAEKLTDSMPLNKFVAHCGICSRRDAIPLIRDGRVKVGKEVILEPGYKVTPSSTVTLDGKTIEPRRQLVYYLLNKPKNYITTTEDPDGRHTVMELIQAPASLRIFPVGRLDRNTTGLLLLTNDGDLSQKLSHPRNRIRKVYQVGLDKPLLPMDYQAIRKGLLLEDGLIEVDDLAYTDPGDKSLLGIEIHSGRNRIVRRIFEHLGYTVKRLDRVVYAGLTKKNLPRGHYRELEPKEVILLKHFKPG